jgi:urea transport system substrate-binding protein
VYLWKKAVEKAGRTDAAAVRQALRGLSVEAPDGTLEVADNLHAYRTARVGVIEPVNGQIGFRIVYQSPSALAPEPFPDGHTERQWKALLKKWYDDLGGAWGKGQ